MDFLEMREAVLRATGKPESDYSRAYERIKLALTEQDISTADAHTASLRITNIVWDLYRVYAKESQSFEEFLSQIFYQATLK